MKKTLRKALQTAPFPDYDCWNHRARNKSPYNITAGKGYKNVSDAKGRLKLL